LTPLNLVPAVAPNGLGVLRTALDDDQGPLTLHLVPTDAANDAGVDGSVLLTAAARPWVDEVFRDLARGLGDPADQGRTDELGLTPSGLQEASRATPDLLAVLLGQGAADPLHALPGCGAALFGQRGRGRRDLRTDRPSSPAGNEAPVSEWGRQGDAFASAPQDGTAEYA
jgi:hypothetical protein